MIVAITASSIVLSAPVRYCIELSLQHWTMSLHSFGKLVLYLVISVLIIVDYFERG